MTVFEQFYSGANVLVPSLKLSVTQATLNHDKETEFDIPISTLDKNHYQVV